ncbi:MAG: zf-HC2 domain-containing protein [Gemmatimonadales bacterium]
MSHLDEGTLHALIDGELELTEVKEIQAHLGSCAACGSRLREVREFLAESDRLVATLQYPAIAKHPADPPPAAPPAHEASPPRERRPPPRNSPNDTPQVLLIPDNPEYGLSGRWSRGMRWAALLAVTVGAGYLANEVRRRGELPLAEMAREGRAYLPKLAPVVSPEEASSRETVGADSTTVAKSAAPARATPPPVQPRPKPAPPPRTERPQSAAVADEAAEPADRAGDISAGILAGADSTEALEQAAAGEEFNVDRARAAQATADLDRERRRQRAAAATARLDSLERLREAESRIVPRGVRGAAGQVTNAAAPPAPRTLEQRSQIYLRIGLDEAARQLGRPVHVIEGMTPAFMGLAQGRLSPGADSTRPVVRVVYQDVQGRMILLDQQRLRPGQSATASESHWTYGEIVLHLHGEVGPEILRSLRPRVR